MNQNTTTTGAGNTTAAQLFSDCMNHLQSVCMKTKDEALAIMSEGAAGVVFQCQISKAKNTTTAQVQAVNEAHWAEDYSDAALPDDRFLRRRLARRAREAGLDVNDLVMGEFGPAGAYAYKIDERGAA